MKDKVKKIIPKRVKKLAKDEDFKYILKNSRYNVYIEVANLIMGFIISWCFANYTSPEFYGTYLLIISIITFFSFLTFSGINQALIQSTSNGYDYFFITSMKKSFKYSLLGSLTIIIYGIIFTFFFEFNYIILVCLVISGTTFAFTTSLSLYQNFLFGKEEYKKSFMYRMFIFFLRNVLIIILIFYTRDLILHFLLLNIALILSHLYFTKSCIKLIEKKVSDSELDREALSYGLLLTKYGVVSLITGNITNFVVGTFFGPAILAFYTVGKSLASKLINFVKPALSTLLTKYSKPDVKLSKKFLFIIIGFSIMLFVGIIIIMPFYLQILFPKYVDSIGYGIAFAFIILIYPLLVVFGYYFRGKVEKRVIRNVLLIPNIIHLILLIPLMLLFGVYGLILAEFLKYFIMLIVNLLNIDKINFN